MSLPISLRPDIQRHASALPALESRGAMPRTSSRSGSPARSFSPGYASPLHWHLFDAGLMRGALSDIQIQAFGRLYSLHRLVLAQSAFFSSLLQGGFSEQLLGESQGHIKPIDLTFPANCSRAAFEWSIARLYGGGPQLVPPKTSQPDAARGYPLTETFARQAAQLAPLSEAVHDSSEVQLATPSFVLSLLATASYLELPHIVQQALQLVFDTITPYTVASYFRFACDGCVPNLEADEPCAGLAYISSELPEAANRESTQSSSYFYGSMSDSIGEACACWMARWACDILPVEEAQAEDAVPRIRVFSYAGLGGIPSSWLRALLASDALFLDRPNPLLELDVSSEYRRYDLSKRAVDMRRRQKAAWLASFEAPDLAALHLEPDDGIDDADSSGEETKQTRRSQQRQSIGASILTSSEASLEDDEAEYELLFSEGIYFSQLPFDTLKQLLGDVSPMTGRPYVSPAVLFRAHWDATRLRGLFPTEAVNASVEDIETRASLGLVTSFRSSGPIAPTLQPSSTRRWVVPIDETIRINESSQSDFDAVSPPANDGLLLSTSPLGNSGKPVVRSKQGAWQPKERWFGLANPMISTEEGRVPGLDNRSFVTFEPFRFSIEFWDIEQLKEKQRLYSQTISYVGSSWNIYLQVLRKSRSKVQFGIYLHRASPHVSLPAASKPPSLTAAEIASNPMPKPQLSTQDRDKRDKVKAFFSLTCHNLAGISLTRFASAPDSFALSQSWGWKSSSLRGDDYVLNLSEDEHITKFDIKRAAQYTSLRCSVVLGLV